MRLTLALLALSAVTAFGESYTWISSGSRSENPLVLSLLADCDLATAEAALDALSQRRDDYVEDIIAALLDQHSPRAVLLLGMYLQRVTGRPESGLATWARTNPAAVERLVGSLDSQGDPYLRAYVLALLPLAERSVAVPALSRELAWLAERATTAAGGRLRELRAALLAAQRLGAEELATPVLRIAADSRDPATVALARQVAAELLDTETSERERSRR